MPPHEQTWVKVNAPVDQRISGIISALGEFPSLESIESCEGRRSHGAWVCFRYGSYWKHPWKDLAEFVLGYLAPGLVEALGDDVSVRIQVTPSGQIFGELSVRAGAEYRVEVQLRKLAKGFSAARPHSLACCGDMSGTLP
jgi:hypothetical protein